MTNLTDYKALSFDVYGTLVDWETGVLKGLQPLLDRTSSVFDRAHLLDVYHECERNAQQKDPGLKYSQLLTRVHPLIAEKLGLAAPSEQQKLAFGESVGQWPAFPDTVGALKRLAKHYKLVVLSNTDRTSFANTNSGPLQGIPFDLVITAEDVGSYKPDPRNFEYMIEEVKKRFGIEKEEILQTAQSQFHDHHPAKSFGIKSSWIVRPGATMGNLAKEIYDWKFDTLGDMADALESDMQASVGK
jgi:2-haloalkanoic acid dehalogenase type II